MITLDSFLTACLASVRLLTEISIFQRDKSCRQYKTAIEYEKKSSSVHGFLEWKD